MTVVLVVAAVWGFVLLLVVALTLTAKHADEDTARAARRYVPAVEALPGQLALGRLAAEVQEALGADWVAVLLADPGEEAAHAGRVAACAGAPAILGARVGLDSPAAPLRPAAEDAVDSAPLTRAGATIGAVVVARRLRPFARGDHAQLERLATTDPPRFERVRRPALRRSRA